MIFMLGLLNIDMGNIFPISFLEMGKVDYEHRCLIFYLGIEIDRYTLFKNRK